MLAAYFSPSIFLIPAPVIFWSGPPIAFNIHKNAILCMYPFKSQSHSVRVSPFRAFLRTVLVTWNPTPSNMRWVPFAASFVSVPTLLMSSIWSTVFITFPASATLLPTPRSLTAFDHFSIVFPASATLLPTPRSLTVFDHFSIAFVALAVFSIFFALLTAFLASFADWIAFLYSFKFSNSILQQRIFSWFLKLYLLHELFLLQS